MGWDEDALGPLPNRHGTMPSDGETYTVVPRSVSDSMTVSNATDEQETKQVDHRVALTPDEQRQVAPRRAARKRERRNRTAGRRARRGK